MITSILSQTRNSIFRWEFTFLWVSEIYVLNKNNGDLWGYRTLAKPLSPFLFFPKSPIDGRCYIFPYGYKKEAIKYRSFQDITGIKKFCKRIKCQKVISQYTIYVLSEEKWIIAINLGFNFSKESISNLKYWYKYKYNMSTNKYDAIWSNTDLLKYTTSKGLSLKFIEEYNTLQLTEIKKRKN